MSFVTAHWDNEKQSLRILDQTLLPDREEYLDLLSCERCVEAIKNLRVRGAPLIGVVAAYGVYLASNSADNWESYRTEIKLLRAARPTALNLNAAVDFVTALDDESKEGDGIPQPLIARHLQRATEWAEQEAETCDAIGRHGADLLPESCSVMTYCNAGKLATNGLGTALAPIYRAVEDGKRVKVYCCETRPVNQGARLTAWELSQSGISTCLIADNAIGDLLRSTKIDAIITGADHVTQDGHVINKIGTYNLSILARQHGVPLWVAFPSSTLGEDDAVPEIEQRDPAEVFPYDYHSDLLQVRNCAFDVTYPDLVEKYITENGVFEREDGVVTWDVRR